MVSIVIGFCTHFSFVYGITIVLNILGFYLASVCGYLNFLFLVQIFEIVNLANELLPPLPQGTISLPSRSNVFVKGSLTMVPPVVSEERDDSFGNEISTREKLLIEQPELLQKFGMDLLPVLIQVNFQII